jgi:hypothetical protein
MASPFDFGLYADTHRVRSGTMKGAPDIDTQKLKDEVQRAISAAEAQGLRPVLVQSEGGKRIPLNAQLTDDKGQYWGILAMVASRDRIEFEPMRSTEQMQREGAATGPLLHNWQPATRKDYLKIPSSSKGGYFQVTQEDLTGHAKLREPKDAVSILDRPHIAGPSLKGQTTGGASGTAPLAETLGQTPQMASQPQQQAPGAPTQPPSQAPQPSPPPEQQSVFQAGGPAFGTSSLSTLLPSAQGKRKKVKAPELTFGQKVGQGFMRAGIGALGIAISSHPLLSSGPLAGLGSHLGGLVSGSLSSAIFGDKFDPSKSFGNIGGGSGGKGSGGFAGILGSSGLGGILGNVLGGGQGSADSSAADKDANLLDAIQKLTEAVEKLSAEIGKMGQPVKPGVDEHGNFTPGGFGNTGAAQAASAVHTAANSFHGTTQGGSTGDMQNIARDALVGEAARAGAAMAMAGA